jgi:hypothetical protein
MYDLRCTLLLLLSWISAAVPCSAQITYPFILDRDNAIQNCPTCGAGLTHWYKVLPYFSGGPYEPNLAGLGQMNLTNMATGSGWSSSTRPGSYGQIQFDGTNDYLRGTTNLGFTAESQPYTLCAWVKPTSVGSGQQVLFSTNDGNSPFTDIQFYWSNASNPMFRSCDSYGYCQEVYASTSPVAGIWQHWCAVRAGAGIAAMSLWLNGLQVPTSAGNNQAFYAGYDNVPWTIGAVCCAAPGSYFQGSLDDMMIWQRAMSATEIWQLYTGTAVARPLEPDAVPLASSAPPTTNPRRRVTVE